MSADPALKDAGSHQGMLPERFVGSTRNPRLGWQGLNLE